MSDSSARGHLESIRYTTVVIAALAAVVLVWLLPFMQLTENLFYDLRVTFLLERVEPAPDVVLVGITEETLSTMPYRSPVDRTFLSRLTRDLEAKGARLIAFDILFDQATEVDKDRELRETFESVGLPIIVAAAGSRNNLLEQQRDFLAAYTQNLLQGNATVYRDSLDSVVRTFPLRIQRNGESELGFAARIAETVGADVPVGETLFLDYRLTATPDLERFASYPAHTVELLPATWFDGKIVLVGAELELEDRHATPYSRLHALGTHVPGLHIQAHALSQLLEQRTLWVPGAPLTFVACLLLAVLGQLVIRGRERIRFQLLIRPLGFLLLWGATVAMSARVGIIIEFMAPALSLFLSALEAILRQWRRESENRRFIQGAFAKYLSPQFVDQLAQNPEALRVGGERKKMTFLFTDLAGFTPLTESLEADELVRLLNEYLDGTCEIVTRHGGMVASIIGDALYVIFNAPLAEPEHARKAVDAALELDSFCVDFEQRKRAAGIELDVTRIGVNTGYGVLGNFGGEQRLEYTAIGDGINVAARLESVNKHLGTRICISESTVAQCPGHEFRPVGRLVLKGKSSGIMTFTPILDEDDELSEGYREAYSLMEQEAPDAFVRFSQLREKFPQDALIRFHYQRLEAGQSGDLVVMEEK